MAVVILRRSSSAGLTILHLDHRLSLFVEAIPGDGVRSGFQTSEFQGAHRKRSGQVWPLVLVVARQVPGDGDGDVRRLGQGKGDIEFRIGPENLVVSFDLLFDV